MRPLALLLFCVTACAVNPAPGPIAPLEPPLCHTVFNSPLAAQAFVDSLWPTFSPTTNPPRLDSLRNAFSAVAATTTVTSKASVINVRYPVSASSLVHEMTHVVQLNLSQADQARMVSLLQQPSMSDWRYRMSILGAMRSTAIVLRSISPTTAADFPIVWHRIEQLTPKDSKAHIFSTASEGFKYLLSTLPTQLTPQVFSQGERLYYFELQAYQAGSSLCSSQPLSLALAPLPTLLPVRHYPSTHEAYRHQLGKSEVPEAITLAPMRPTAK